MDVKLEKLIETIRQEAVDKGQLEADSIIDDATEKAEKIIKDAENKAEKLIKNAEKDAEKIHEKTRQALKQAARDVELSLKEKISALFDRVFKNEVAKTMKPEFLETLVRDIIKQWSKDGSIEIGVNSEVKKNLEKTLFAGLNDEVKQGVTLAAAQGLTHGFRVMIKDASVYYDFSDKTIAETLKVFISPSLREILYQNDKKNG